MLPLFRSLASYSSIGEESDIQPDFIWLDTDSTPIIVELTENYLAHSGIYKHILGRSMEDPAVFKRDNKCVFRV